MKTGKNMAAAWRFHGAPPLDYGFCACLKKKRMNAAIYLRFLLTAEHEKPNSDSYVHCAIRAATMFCS
ncbi:hypothetical protein [Acidocella sp.]|uniref:hypothetical protein n=1 Tax=Acidocella sp. TaxID=50710 RepID=UPI003D04CE71